jgi:radical SAM superfamily enzyme YgiQ (UPF0313 family)
MYKDRKFRVRPLEDILEDIRMARSHYGDLDKAFLLDGDAIALDTPLLLEILDNLYDAFPSLRHVGSYVGPKSTLKKSVRELALLRTHGLTKAYLGVESGDEAVLKSINKGVTAEEMLKAGQNLVRAGINLSSMVLLGIAGTGPERERHAIRTAEITNQMKPHYLAALTYTPVPGTPFFNKVASGALTLPDPFETLSEMKLIFEKITLDNLKFVGAHASNYLPISGTLQRDKEAMLDQVNQVLETRDLSAIRPESQRGL